MGNNDLAIRFTENKYSTRIEVSKELKMSLIDNIWANILSYRSAFNQYLNIKSIDRNSFLVCYCPTVTGSINELDAKLLRILREYMRMNPNNGDVKQFEDACLIKSLQSIADKYDLDVTEPYLRTLVQGDMREISSTHRILLHYLNALTLIKSKFSSPIDIDFLAELYAKLIGNPELTSFYRTTDDKNPENRVIIDRVYTCAPVNLIESLMNGLFAFIQGGKGSGLVKSIATYYYINYIRPFPSFSDEIALLMAKAVLAHSGLSEFGALIPLESLLTENQDVIAKLFLEVQKTNDLTYFVNYAVAYIDDKCEKVLDYIANRSSEQMKKDYYRAEEVASESAAPKVEVRHDPIPVEEDHPIITVIAPKEPIIEKKVAPVLEKKEAPIAPAVEKVETREVQIEKIAVSYIPPVLDEKQACRLEEHLLELDPSLKRNEAKFYARHCTLGKKYTIAQCKKALGCAYETARTSMDHLMDLGYYRKEMVKNKNVYTPIPRN
ncbi:MAG TPA: hypothetical protein PKO28_01635 [Bacilli bacterium]|nr:hypothetical protein [Bacilli bacterium]HPS19070.1 hypothetical protein [Bacilli bacterium]